MTDDEKRAARVLETKRRAASHPDRQGERCNAVPGQWTPVVDHGRCEGKRDCIVVCPNDVFEVRRIDDVDYDALGLLARFKVTMHSRQTAYAAKAEDCRACGLCVVACPESAITLIPPAR